MLEFLGPLKTPIIEAVANGQRRLCVAFHAVADFSKVLFLLFGHQMPAFSHEVCDVNFVLGFSLNFGKPIFP
jgi:hypothetical protein